MKAPETGSVTLENISADLLSWPDFHNGVRLLLPFRVIDTTNFTTTIK